MDLQLSHVTRSTIVALVALSFGCSGNLGSITVTKESDSKTIDGVGSASTNTSNDELNNRFPPISYDISLDNQSEGRGSVKEVNMESFKMQLAPDSKGKTFDFLDNITFYVNADGKEKKKIAQKKNISEGKSELDFDVDSDINLKSYIKKGFKITPEAKGTPPEKDTKFKTKTTLRFRFL